MIYGLIFCLLNVNSLDGWIWYKEKTDTLSDTLKNEERDTARYVFEGLEIPKPESLPIEEDAPPVVKRLLRNPTPENAEEFVRWQAALMERATLASILVKKAAVGLGVVGTREKVRGYKEKQREKKLENIKKEIILVALLGNDIESKYLVRELERFYTNGFFVYAFAKDTLYNSFFPVRKYKGQLNFLGERAEAPLVLYFEPETKKYQILTRRFDTFNRIRDNLIDFVIKEENRGTIP